MAGKELQSSTKEFELPQATFVMSRTAGSHKVDARKLTKRPGDNVTGFWFPVNRAQEEVFESLTCTKALLGALDTMNSTVEHSGGVEGQVGAMYSLKKTLTTGVEGTVRQQHLNYKFTITVSEAPDRFEYLLVFNGKRTRTTYEIFATGPKSCEVWVLYPERSPQEDIMESLKRGLCICPCCYACYPCCVSMHMSSMQTQIAQMADSLELFLSTYTPPRVALESYGVGQ